MKKEMQELADFALKTAKEAGAGNCRVGIHSRRFVSVSYRERKPENIKEATTQGLSIEIFVNGRYSAQSTSDLRRDALRDFISGAVKTTRLLAEDPYRSLPDPKYCQTKTGLDLGILDSAYENISAEDRHKMVKAAEESCLAAGGKKVITVQASAYDSYSENVVTASNGFEGYRESTYFQVGAQMTALDESDRRPMEGSYAAAVRRKDLPSPEAVGEEAARRTLAMLGGKKLKTETMPVIIENRIVARLVGGLIEAMTGANLQQKRSFLADKKGKKVASSLFTLIDDPHLRGGLGSRLFDGDGLATEKRVILDAGMLKDFYIDWYYSRKLGCEPTVDGPSNLIIPAGKRSVKEIMKDVGRGILITGFIGGNSNSTTGDASVGIIGRLFENGEPGQAVSEMNIADNHLNFWQRVAEVANDPWIYSGWRMPSLLITDVVVSGI